MKSKSNISTPLRPEGDRMLYAPMLEMDLNRFLEQIKNETAWKRGDRNAITIFKSDSMRIVLVGLHKRAVLKTHNTNFVISVQVLEGFIKFTVGDKIFPLVKGQMVALQPKIPHGVEAEKDSFFLLTMVNSGATHKR